MEGVRHLAELGIVLSDAQRQAGAVDFTHLPVCTAGIVRDVEGVRHLAELGVVFLLFNIGLELSLERLHSMQKFVFGLGGLQVHISKQTTMRCLRCHTQASSSWFACVEMCLSADNFWSAQRSSWHL